MICDNPCVLNTPPPSPPAHVGRTNGATTFDKAALVGLSVIDMIQTQRLLTTNKYGYERNPLIGKHPSLTRIVLSGAAADFGLLEWKSPFVRHLAIGIEAVNVGSNFAQGFYLTSRIKF